MGIDPANCPRHDQLVFDVTALCQSLGCVVSHCGYESVFPVDVKNVLSRTGNVDMTSLYVRSRKDLIAVHPVTNRSLLLDPKTTNWRYGDSNDFPIEVVPLYHACRNWSAGVKTLFCCRYGDGFDFGVWPVSELLEQALDLRFPIWKYTDQDVKDLMSYYRPYFPTQTVDRFSSCNGSGDGYARFSSSVFRDTWQQRIVEFFKEQS